MGIYTKQEIIDKIKKVDSEIEVAQSTNEYELNTGQGSQRVRRVALEQLIKMRDYWLRELANIDVENGRIKRGGILYGEFRR
ncbi:MAG: hypothetical protein LBF97_01095 [Elusimicrobiota bacterium]|jgi:hypothetical protein|nr:hypothetical protein [Elusimicrobiota bacterium]